MTKLSYARMAISGLITIGVGKIVGDIIANNTDPEGKIDYVTYKVGSYALGGMIAAQTVDYADKTITAIVENHRKEMDNKEDAQKK